MTIHKSTGATIFICTDDLPRHPTQEQLKNAKWVEVGLVTDFSALTDHQKEMVEFYEQNTGIKIDKVKIKARGSYELLHKPKPHKFTPPKPRKKWQKNY